MPFPTFNGAAGEDAQEFLDNLEIACLVTGRDDDATRLRVFPLLMKAEAKVWFNTLLPANRGDWAGLRVLFLAKFGGGGETSESLWGKVCELRQSSLFEYNVYECIWGINRYKGKLCNHADEAGVCLPLLEHGDDHLCELENQAFNLALTPADSRELVDLSGKLVAKGMGSQAESQVEELIPRWKTNSKALKDCLSCVVCPIGSVSVRVCKHQALLFKVLADSVNLPCWIARERKYCGFDDGVSCLVPCKSKGELQTLDGLAKNRVQFSPQGAASQEAPHNTIRWRAHNQYAKRTQDHVASHKELLKEKHVL
ncbi:hypothetical protein L7F22_061770 [Adiantum nelumboides]|nr:hypothetical protein [Adiantum nelumboides]